MHSRFGPLYLVLTLLTGCGSHGTGEHSELPIVSSTATADQNGNVQIRPATSSELSELGTTEGKIAAVDRRYPRPEIPKGVVPLRGARMLMPAIVEVADGRKFYLDGITCSAIGLVYLSRRMIDTETYLLVVPVHNSTDQPIAADVWIREESDGQTSYTSPAETALTSGWCDVQPGTSSRRKDRSPRSSARSARSGRRPCAMYPNNRLF